MNGSPGPTDHQLEPSEEGSLARVSTGIVWISFICAASALVFAIYSHQRWISAAAQLKAYGIPVAALVLLLILLRGRTSLRIAAALFIVPLVVVLLAADLLFARPERIVRRWGLQFLVERRRSAVARDLRANGIRAYPSVTPAEFHFGEQMVNARDARFLPLSSVSGAPTVLCTEGELVVSYLGDEFGFNNPPGLWRDDSARVAMVGDSFVAGSCVTPHEHFVTIVRDRIPGIINAGVIGNGPLSELAVLREYVTRVHPKHVLWFFFEGNDMEELETEKRFVLRRYLDPSFTQNLVASHAALDSAVADYAMSVIQTSEVKPIRTRLLNLMLLRDLRIGLEGSSGAEVVVDPDFALLKSVLAEAKRTVNSWGGTMTLVYLPEQHRLQRDAPQPLSRIHDVDVIHSNVVAIARNIDLPMLDVGPIFSKDPNAKALFWRPRTHYSPYGNRVLANAVADYLR